MEIPLFTDQVEDDFAVADETVNVIPNVELSPKPIDVKIEEF